MTGGKRKRIGNASVVDDEHENSIEELNSKMESLQENVGKFLENMEKKQSENDSQISEKLQFICDKLEKIEKKSEESDVEKEKKPSFNSVISPGYLKKNTPIGGIPVGRSFRLKHVFENVSKFEENKRCYNEKEEHFGVPWRMYVSKREEHLAFYLECNKSLETEKWAVDTKFSLQLIGMNGMRKMGECEKVYGNYDGNKEFNGTGWEKFISWEELKKDYLIDDKLTAEIYVKINKMTGVYKKNSKIFDESVKECSDVTLKVDDEKFYVAKLFLSYNSTYFKTLFLGQFQESNQSEIQLSGIAAEDFQNFLEVLYGEPSIDEITVEGILLVADMYDTSIAIRKCQEFLIEKSTKSNKKKLQMSIRYNLDKLKRKCLSEIKTVADIKSMISGTIKDLDPSITTELLERAISLQ